MNKLNKDNLQQLLDQTKISKRLRMSLRFVPDEIPWENLDFVAVMNRAESEGVILAPLNTLFVIPFSIQKKQPNNAGRSEAIICDFCKTWQRGSNASRISFTREKSSVSFLCCADLLCSLHVRDMTKSSILSRVQLKEAISKDRRIERLRIRLEEILNSI